MKDITDFRNNFLDLARRWVTIGILIGLLVLTAWDRVEAKTDQVSAKRKLESIQRKIEANRAKIQQSKKKEKLLVKDLILLNRDLSYTGYQLKKAERDLSFYKEKASETRLNLEGVREVFRDKQAQFQGRIVQIYKNKNVGIIEFLFSPKDFSLVMDSSYYFERIIKADVTLIEEIKQEYNKLAREMHLLHFQTEKITSIQDEISKKKESLSEQQKRKTNYIGMLRTEIESYERANEALLQSSREIAVLIQQTGSRGGGFGTGSFIHPVLGWVSSVFGYRTHPILKRLIFHNGIDFAAPSGHEIKAADSGVVIFAGRWGGYGNATIIDHGKDITTVYAHQSRIVVQHGQRVQKGQLIGYVGSTGFATGPHLHFQVRLNGQPINPFRYLGG